MKSEQRARLQEMAEWLDSGDLGAEGSVMLAESVAQEHSADLSAALAIIASLEAEAVKDGEAMKEVLDGMIAAQNDIGVDDWIDTLGARLSSRAKDIKQ